MVAFLSFLFENILNVYDSIDVQMFEGETIGGGLRYDESIYKRSKGRVRCVWYL